MNAESRHSAEPGTKGRRRAGSRGGPRCLRDRVWRGFVVALLCGLALVFLFPIVWSVAASLKPSLGEVYQSPPSLTTTHPRWANYRDALSDLPFFDLRSTDVSVFGRAWRVWYPDGFFVNSIIVCVCAVVGQVFTASLAGYAFARLKWRGRDFWFIVLLASMMLPGQVLLIPHYLIYKNVGWLDTYKPLIVPSWLGGGAFYIFLFRQFFRGIPRETEEAAHLDGATPWQTYWHVILPNAKPAVATVTVMAFIAHWKEFMGPLIYLGDLDKYPVSLGLQMFNSQEGSFVHLLMAASAVALAPLVALFFVAQRYIVRGMLLSGSKR